MVFLDNGGCFSSILRYGGSGLKASWSVDVDIIYVEVMCFVLLVFIGLLYFVKGFFVFVLFYSIMYGYLENIIFFELYIGFLNVDFFY